MYDEYSERAEVPSRPSVYEELLTARDAISSELKALRARLQPALRISMDENVTSAALAQVGDSPLRDLHRSLIEIRLEITDLLGRLEI